MSLLTATMTVGGSLLEHRRESFTRSRPTISSRDNTTGAPIPGTPSTGNFTCWFSWMSEREVQDYEGDAAAFVLTTPGELQPGDTVTHATLGSFVVLEAGVKANGDFDRANLKRST